MMGKSAFTMALAVAAVLVVAGLLLAGNMGFKLNYSMTGPGAYPENGGNTLSLPYGRSFVSAGGSDPEMVNASDILIAINGGLCSGGPAKAVAKYEKAIAGLFHYDGCTGSDFALVRGEGVFLSLYTDVSLTVAGAHDPALTVNLTGPGAPPVNGVNYYAHPYHATASTAEDLGNDIGGFDAVNAANPVVSISRYLKATAGLEAYNGQSGTNFPLTPGEAYFITVDTDVTYIPSHF